MAIVVLALYISIPVFSILRLLFTFEKAKVNNSIHFAKFGALYEGLAVKHGRIVMIEPIAFLARRIFLPMLIIFGTKVFIYQMIWLLLTNLTIMIITLASSSLTSASERRLQTFAEMSIQMTSLCFLCFNIVSVKSNFALGYTSI